MHTISSSFVFNKAEFSFEAPIWQYSPPGGWFFVTVPDEISAEIREHLKWQEEGWGRLKATAAIGSFTWDTAIWYDTKHKAYLLPLKAEIRKELRLSAGDDVLVKILV